MGKEQGSRINRTYPHALLDKGQNLPRLPGNPDY